MLNIRPEVRGLASRFFSDQTEVSAHSMANRRGVDFAKWFSESVAWTDHSGKESYVASVTWKEGNHVRCIVREVGCGAWAVLYGVGNRRVNSPDGCGSLIDIMDQGMGVVVMCVSDSKNVLAESECSYVFI